MASSLSVEEFESALAKQREEEPQEFSVEAFNQRMKEAEQQLKQDVESRRGGQDLREMQARGVDITTGGSAGLRAELSLTSPDRQREILVQEFGEGNVEESSRGWVVTTEEGQLLLDESGLSMADFADLAGGATEVAGAIGGASLALGTGIGAATLTTGGVIPLIVIAGMAGAGGQLGASLAEIASVMSRTDVTAEDLQEIGKRRGVNAIQDTILDLLTVGGFRIGKGVAQFGAGPMARRMAEPVQQAVKGAAERLGVQLTPGTQTGSNLLIRAEAFLEKIPGSSSDIKRIEQDLDKALFERQAELRQGAPTSEEAGEAMMETLTKKRNELQAEIDEIRSIQAQITERRLQDLLKTSRSRPLSMSEAGELSRRKLLVERNRFRARQTVKEDKFDATVADLPEEQQAFAGTDIIRKRFNELRDELPNRQVVEEVDIGLLDQAGRPITREEARTEVLREYVPSNVLKFLNGANKLPPKMTVGQLRKMRQSIANAIDDKDALPGISTGMLKQAEAAVTRQIAKAADNAPTPEVGAALTDAITHYRQNNKKFRQRIIARAMRAEDRPGALESSAVLPDLILKNKWEDAQRILNVIGADSPVARNAKRAVWEEMLTASRGTLLKSGSIDPKILDRQLSKLRPETKRLLFGDEAIVERAEQLVRLAGARTGAIDISEVRKVPGDEDILTALNRAVRLEIQKAQEFENRVWKRALTSPEAAAQVNPEEFVRYALKNANKRELDRFMNLLPEDQRDAFAKRTIVHLLERSARLSGDPEGVITAFQEGQAQVGEKLLEIIARDFGEETAESIAKIRSVVGEDSFQILKDMGTIQAARVRKAQSAKAVGGLVGGSILSNLITLQVSDAAKVAWFKTIAGFLKSRVVRKWLTDGVKLEDPTKFSIAFQATLPQMVRVVNEEVATPEKRREVIKFLTSEDFEEMVLNQRDKVTTNQAQPTTNP